MFSQAMVLKRGLSSVRCRT